MSEWRILEWARERGRGAITSPHFSRVEFDAAIADVDDFRIGEIVHVELEGGGKTMRVRRLWPDEPRFRTSVAGRPAPPLDESLRVEVELYLQGMSGSADGRALLRPGAVRIELDDNHFEFGPTRQLDILEPSYIDLPMTFCPRFVQLASAAAREYLASRVELGARDIAIAIIDDENRFFFVVGSAVASERPVQGR